jgi:hypothetical protein
MAVAEARHVPGTARPACAREAERPADAQRHRRKTLLARVAPVSGGEAIASRRQLRKQLPVDRGNLSAEAPCARAEVVGVVF